MDTVTTKTPVPPPSPLEIQRKLSVHAKPKTKLSVSPNTMSGTESDSDSQVLMEIGSPHAHVPSSYASGSQQPLQSIKEREQEAVSGEETDEDEDDEGGEWKTTDKKGQYRAEQDAVVKSGYLWKKGSRRKTWKKRWFVLRTPHLAYYKTNAEYQLLRLLDLNEVHSVTPVLLKKHVNTFGLVLPTRTLYLQAESEAGVTSWVKALNDARERLQSTMSITPVPTPPVTILERAPQDANTLSASPPHHHPATSSDEEGPGHSSPGVVTTFSPAKGTGAPVTNDPTKVILSGYLMKCGKRKTWRKRWFILSGEKLTYCGNHMDNKHQRQIPLAQILDAMESEFRSNPNHRHHGTLPQSPGMTVPPIDDLADPHGTQHTFKIITTKRTLLLCAPSEEEEIRWLSAVRALIARRSGPTVSPPSQPVSTGLGGIKGGRRRSITGGGGSGVEGMVGA